jgi:hypothetical protein
LAAGDGGHDGDLGVPRERGVEAVSPSRMKNKPFRVPTTTSQLMRRARDGTAQ